MTAWSPSALRERIERDIPADRSQLRIAPRELDAADAAEALAAVLGQESIELLRPSTPELSEDEVIRVGGSVDLLGVQGWQARALFRTQGGGVQLRVDLTPPLDWQLDHCFGDLQGSVFSKLSEAAGTRPCLRLSTWAHLDDEGRDVPEGLSLLARVLPASLGLSSFNWLAGSATSAEVCGPITLGPGGDPSWLHIELEVRLDSPCPSFPGFGSPQLHLVRIPAEPPLPVRTGVRISAEAQVGGVTLRPEYLLERWEPAVMELRLELEGAALPTPQEIATLCGTEDLLSALPTFDDASLPMELSGIWVGIGALTHEVEYAGFALSLALDEPAAVAGGLLSLDGGRIELVAWRPFDSQQRRLTSGLTALTTLAGGQLDLQAAWPTWRMSAALREDSSIALDALVEAMLGGALGDLPELDISRLGVLGDPRSGSFHLDAALSADWPIEIGDITLHLSQACFLISRPGKSQTLTGSVSGLLAIAGIPLQVSATRDAKTGWFFECRTRAGATLPLGDAVEEMTAIAGFHVQPELPEVAVTDLVLRFGAQNRAVTASARTAEAVEIPVGPSSVRLGCSFALDAAPGRPLGLRFNGDLEVGGHLVRLAFELGDRPAVRGSWTAAPGEALGLDDLLDTVGFDLGDLPLPKGLDLGLTGLAFTFSPSSQRFELSGGSRSLGDAFVSAEKVAGQWALVLGLAVPDGMRFASLPGDLGKALAPADTLGPTRAGLLVSNRAQPAFTIDGFPALAGSPVRLVRGATLFFELGGGGGGDPALENALAMVGGDALRFRANVGTKAADLELLADLGELPLRVGGQAMTIRDAALAVRPKPTAARLEGALTVPLGDSKLDAKFQMAIGQTAATASLNIEMEGGYLRGPVGLKGVYFEQIGGQIGVTFAPAAGLVLGLQGRFRIGVRAVEDNAFAFVFAFSGMVPTPQVMHLRVATLDLPTLVQAVDGKRPSLPGIVSKIRAEDLVLYWASVVWTLPDGTVATPGFGLNGFITIAGLRAFANLQVRDSGVSGIATMGPLRLSAGKQEVLAFTGRGKGIERKDEHSGAIEVIVPPGGPVAQFDPKGSPILWISAQVALLGFARRTIEVEVGTDGLSFLFCEELGGASQTFTCELTNRGSFYASGELSLKLAGKVGPLRAAGVNLGKIDLDVALKGALSLSLTAKRFELRVEGGFRWGGMDLTMPPLALKAAPRSLKKLPSMLLDHIDDHAETIFAELLDAAAAALDAAEAAAEEIAKAGEVAAKAIADGAERAAGEIVDAAEAVAAETEALGTAIAGAAKDIAKLEDAAEAEVTAAVAKAEKSAQKIAAESKQIAGDAAKEARKIADDAQRLAKALESDAKAVADKAAKEIERIGKQAAKEVEAIAKDAKKQVAKIGKDAEKEAKKIADSAGKAAKKGAKKVGKKLGF